MCWSPSCPAVPAIVSAPYTDRRRGGGLDGRRLNGRLSLGGERPPTAPGIRQRRRRIWFVSDLSAVHPVDSRIWRDGGRGIILTDFQIVTNVLCDHLQLSQMRSFRIEVIDIKNEKKRI